MEKKVTPDAMDAERLTDERTLEIAHRKAWRYKQSSDQHHSDTYTFNRACLLDYTRAIESAVRSHDDALLRKVREALEHAQRVCDRGWSQGFATTADRAEINKAIASLDERLPTNTKAA